MTGVIIGISLSWKYGKKNNIKCLFLSQMFTISGIHVIHIHVLKKVMGIKPPSLWAFQVVQISQLSTITNWISFWLHPFTTSVARLHRVTTYLWTRNRCQQPRTSASTRNDVIPSVDASKVWLQFKIYLLDRGSVRRINCPVNMVKMAAGHLPTSSHNFAWRGVINHDRTTKLTLQNKYDHTMPAGYPKVASPLEISFWMRNLFTHGQTLPGRFAIDSEAIDRRVDVVYRDIITGSRESRDHHYDARLIHRILKSLLPQNNTFFIATASVVKDTADNPDCQGLRERETVSADGRSARPARLGGHPIWWRWHGNTKSLSKVQSSDV